MFWEAWNDLELQMCAFIIICFYIIRRWEHRCCRVYVLSGKPKGTAANICFWETSSPSTSTSSLTSTINYPCYSCSTSGAGTTSPGARTTGKKLQWNVLVHVPLKDCSLLYLYQQNTNISWIIMNCHSRTSFYFSL